MAWSLPMWHTKIRERAAVAAAPPPDSRPFEAPNPGGAPYVPANHDFSDGRLSPNYETPMQVSKDRTDKGAVSITSRPSPQRPAEDWSGYEMVGDYGRSQAYEHLNNGREGLPLKFQSQHKPALNPYQTRIPDERTQRAPHEWDFQRPFDQPDVLGERNLNGMHYSAANIGMTHNPSDSLKGMSPAKRRISTFRLEPTQWGENTVSQASRSGPAGSAYTSPQSALSSSYRLS